MKLTDSTFKKLMDVLYDTYTDWGLTANQKAIWKLALTRTISDEILNKIILSWIINKDTPPKTPADIIQHGHDMAKAELGTADVEANLIISSARNAYYATDEFESFSEAYIHSFAYMIDGRPAQEAYVIDNIQKHSSSPKILILVYDELKGEVEGCFKGDAEHGIEFLRNHIKKNWNTKVDDAVKEYLKSGGSCGQLEA